mgnify:CR=1 FL=1
MRKKLPENELLNSLFTYDGTNLYWKSITSFRTKVADIVGCLSPQGYLVVRIDYELYMVHRIIWKMHYNEEPPTYLDHKNQIKTDNRIANLVESNASNNAKNMPKRIDNKSGHTNIFIRDTGKTPSYQVLIKPTGMQRYCKSFKTLEEAIKNRDEKYKEFNFSENHGKNNSKYAN